MPLRPRPPGLRPPVWLALATTAVLILGCHRDRPPETPAPPPAAVTPGDGAPSSPANEPPGGSAQPPSPPPSLPATGILVSAAAIEPAARLALDPAAETVLDPGSSFEVVLSATVRDARLVLLDAQDAQLPATGTTEVGGRTTLTLAPGAPLVPASRYVLRLEGAVERNLHAASGPTYEPLSFALLAAGTPPPPEPPRKRSRRKRR